MNDAVWLAVPLGLILASAFQSGKGSSKPVVGQIMRGARGETVLVLWTPKKKRKRR